MNTIESIPNDERADIQREEVLALEAIFDGALELQSSRGDDDSEFEFPIVYRINLNLMDVDANNVDGEKDCNGTKNWPIRPLVVEIRYPNNYPSDNDADDPTTTVPSFELLHENTVLEFPSCASEKLLATLCETAENERGMPSVLSCLYAARDFLDGDREWQDAIGGKSNVREGRRAAVKSGSGTIASKAATIDTKTDTKYACISTHHLFDHKPDNLLKTGHKFRLSGFYKFGTPGIAIAWGEEDSIDEFLDILKRAMPQKKFEFVFLRSWQVDEKVPQGWKSVNPPELKEELVKAGVSEEDYFAALGLDKSNIKHATSKGKGKNKNK